MTTLVFLNCTKTKMKKDAKAIDMYKPSTYFSACYDYARTFVDDDAQIYILSSKHKILYHDTIISPYDEDIRFKPKKEQKKWIEEVKSELLQIIIRMQPTRIINLTNVFNTKHVFDAMSISYEAPLKGKALGERVQWIRKYIRKISQKNGLNM